MAVSSTEQGYLYANAYLVARHEPRMYCQPEKLTMAPQQLIDMLRREMKTDDRVAEFPVAFAILDVMIATFPCP